MTGDHIERIIEQMFHLLWTDGPDKESVILYIWVTVLVADSEVYEIQFYNQHSY